MFEAARVVKNHRIRLPALTRLGLYDSRDPAKDRRVYWHLYREEFIYLTNRPITDHDEYQYLTATKVDNGLYLIPPKGEYSLPPHLLQPLEAEGPNPDTKTTDPMGPFITRSGYDVTDEGGEAFATALERAPSTGDRPSDFETGFTRAYFYIDDFIRLVEDHEVFLLTESQFHTLADAALEVLDAEPPWDGLV